MDNTVEQIKKTRCPECGSDLEGKAKYCSQACKQTAYRNRPTVTKATVTRPESVTVKANKVEQGVARATHPDTQAIWDRHAAQHRPMTYPHQFNGRVDLAVPGFQDYEGVCVKDEAGVWTC